MNMSLTMMTTVCPMTLKRFELPDLLVTLCEAGQTSLAARIARSLLGAREKSAGTASVSVSADASASRQPRDVGERGAEQVGVTGDEPQAPAAVEPLQHHLKAPRHRR